jgi:hypothetical protein
MEESNAMRSAMERESRERIFVTYGRTESCNEMGKIIGGCGEITWFVKPKLPGGIVVQGQWQRYWCLASHCVF